jgi:2-(1,2-epoxy-1,2-dihydrophenyl)acetyl-CoA isomerase
VTELVLLEVADGIARLTLHRPDAANSVDLALGRALAAATRELTDRADVRVVLLTGAGTRFCGGGDVRVFADAGDSLADELAAIVDELHAAIGHLAALDAPVVVAVQGSAAGAGLALLLGADLAVVAESAKLVMAYTGIGLTPDGGSTWWLERAIGRQRALDLVLTNRVLTAREALEWGLVARVVPDDDLSAEAEALATELAAGPTRAFGRAKRLLDTAARATLAEQLVAEKTSLVAAGGSRDGQEGVAAFIEKRPPSFEGR